MKITNKHFPAGGTFAISGLRVFGTGHGALPSQAAEVKATRGPYDPLTAHVTWTMDSAATGYNVRWGNAADRLYQSCITYGQHELLIPSLNANEACWVRVDAFNENGITPGRAVHASAIELSADH